MYITRDIYLSSYLVCKGFSLKQCDCDESGVTYFHFEDEVQEEKDKFYQRNATVEPMQYSINMKSLKTKIFENKKNYVSQKNYR